MLPLVPFIQGYKSYSPAIREFEVAATESRLIHGGHPVLRWCISNTVLVHQPGTPQQNRKPEKRRTYGRIDLAVAAIMAIGVMKCQDDAGRCGGYDWLDPIRLRPCLAQSSSMIWLAVAPAPATDLARATRGQPLRGLRRVEMSGQPNDNALPAKDHHANKVAPRLAACLGLPCKYRGRVIAWISNCDDAMSLLTKFQKYETRAARCKEQARQAGKEFRTEVLRGAGSLLREACDGLPASP